MSTILIGVSALPIAYTAWNDKKYARLIIGLVIFHVILLMYFLSDKTLSRGLGYLLVSYMVLFPAWTIAIFYSWYYIVTHLRK